jgi:capsular exopolysaccharide synthesis family protein
MNSAIMHQHGEQARKAFQEVRADAAAPTLVSQVLAILRRRKWLILGCVAAVFFIGLIASLLATPQYTAQATLEIQRETQSIADVDDTSRPAGAADQEFYQTQYGLLEAESLAQRVAASTRLYDNPHFFEMFGASYAENWFEDGRVKIGASTRDQRIRSAAGLLLGNFEVEPERQSRLVKISFTSPDPVISAQVINAWSTDFVEATLERRFNANSYARNFLQTRLKQLRDRINESERQLVNYASVQKIVNLPAQIGSNGASSAERSLAVDDLSTLNREAAQATADRIAAASRLGGKDGQITEALNNGTVSALRQRRAELGTQYAQMMQQFEPSYPPAQALQSQINETDRTIAREVARVTGSLRQSYEAALKREQALQARVEQLKSGVLDLRRRSIEYNIIQRDVDTNRQLYDALLQRFKAIGIAGGVGATNISVVDSAKVPGGPSSPRIIFNLLLATMIGILVAAIAAYVVEQLDQGITDPAEVEATLNMPLLGTVPNVADTDLIALLRDRKSMLAEAYISLRTNLAFSTSHGVPKTIGVTSSRPAEGKSTTSFALAHGLSRSGRRVLLIDGDMRSPSVHHEVGLTNEHGLSNLLSGHDSLDDVIRQTDIDGLAVISAGPIPPSAPELLSGDRLVELFRRLGETYDHIVIDMPPVMGLADAPLIGSMTEAVVFVIEARKTNKSLAQVAIERMLAAHAQVLGVVLTKFDAKRAGYGYGYEYSYGYGDAGSAQARA